MEEGRVRRWARAERLSNGDSQAGTGAYLCFFCLRAVWCEKPGGSGMLNERAAVWCERERRVVALFRFVRLLAAWGCVLAPLALVLSLGARWVVSAGSNEFGVWRGVVYARVTSLDRLAERAWGVDVLPSGAPAWAREFQPVPGGWTFFVPGKANATSVMNAAGEDVGRLADWMVPWGWVRWGVGLNTAGFGVVPELFVVPVWMVVVVFGAVWGFFWWLLPGRIAPGCCVSCGYDLRGIAVEAVCPECGRKKGRGGVPWVEWLVLSRDRVWLRWVVGVVGTGSVVVCVLSVPWVAGVETSRLKVSVAALRVDAEVHLWSSTGLSWFARGTGGALWVARERSVYEAVAWMPRVQWRSTEGFGKGFGKRDVVLAVRAPVWMVAVVCGVWGTWLWTSVVLRRRCVRCRAGLGEEQRRGVGGEKRWGKRGRLCDECVRLERESLNGNGNGNANVNTNVDAKGNGGGVGGLDVGGGGGKNGEHG